ncbi:MAG: T9SS type A sorting domain-containing protein, partial [Prolixibacteraceae bacterium]|nr:T9SS type A sorting domain-containing protein [Prolixibacteraceae bacterium]
RKLFVLITLIIGTHASLFSQEYEYVPFPDSAAIWSEVFYFPSTECEIPAKVFERFALSGEDTIINNKDYKKLYLFYDSVFDKNDAECIGGIREDSLKRVYYAGRKIHNYKPHIIFDEVILYDFSLKIGDTISSGNMYNVKYEMYVEDIDTVLIGNTLRKSFTFSSGKQRWVEGMGCERGLLFAGRYFYSMSVEHDDLICFFQNNNLQYHNTATYSSCFPFETSAHNLKSKISFIAYPNPVTNDKIVFNWNSIRINKIEIYSNNGIRITVTAVVDVNSIEYSTKALPKGYYIYKATTLDNEIITGKFEVK